MTLVGTLRLQASALFNLGITARPNDWVWPQCSQRLMIKSDLNRHFPFLQGGLIRLNELGKQSTDGKL
jgi:hypothetical protein